MGATTRDIFGQAQSAEPATPGSYGEHPQGHRLPATTRLGPVHLQVADLSRSLAFYERVLGLEPVERNSDGASLAPQGTHAPLIVLHEHRGAQAVPRRGALGLYHFAILLPDRPALGRFLRHLGDLGARAGAADHLVSESLYLQDPDNLGIEVYADRPRGTWRRVDRELMMATDPLDIEGLLEAAGSVQWSGMPVGTTMGHVHLHVGDIAQASAFYSEGLGFDRMVWHYPGALFLAAGGYHHHLGTNTWAGSGAAPARPHDARLLEWTIELPDAASVNAVHENLARAGHSGDLRDDQTELVTRDPWGTQVRLLVADRTRLGKE
ncbi:MAG TPA: VOC family protein [Gemmatimonadales bacterium]|nr:VOC family protein [Gemmatimonadales bacterium]